MIDNMCKRKQYSALEVHTQSYKNINVGRTQNSNEQNKRENFVTGAILECHCRWALGQFQWWIMQDSEVACF